MTDSGKWMPQADSSSSDEISVFTLGTILLRNRWRIVRWMALGAIIAAVIVLSRPPLYVASASFVPQGADASRSGLSAIAGQLGVSLPTASQTLTPDFYAKLIKSRVLLRPITRDTFVLPETSARKTDFVDLFEIGGNSRTGREDEAVRRLLKIVSVSVAKTTGVVEVSAATRWPGVSLAIVTALMDGVNEFNLRTRQGQAAAERKFIEGRLAVARADLRQAEDRLEAFLRGNRQFTSSPELTFQRERYQRDVSLKQEVFTSLTQSYEEVRIREVRDTPLITVIEVPSVPTTPESRGGVKSVLLGLLLGGLVGTLLAFITEMMARGQKEGKGEVGEFVGTLGEVRGEMLRPLKRLGARFRR